MSVIGISLFSGGLDSLISVRLMREQGIEVICVTYETPFFSARRAVVAARKAGVPVVVENFTEEYMVMLRDPKYGYGRNMNPCIDCHAFMMRKAGERMEELGADFIFTGEVLGQRPKSQTRQALHIVEKLSGYEGYVVRPLSAKLLKETVPEREGKIDRERLLDIQGRTRRRQMELALRFGIEEYESPAGGCLLTDRGFSNRLRDLLQRSKDLPVRDIELLKVGRHLRLSESSKAVVGRKQADNLVIERLAKEDDTVLTVRDYPGPTTLIPHGCSDEELKKAASITVLYSDAPDSVPVAVDCHSPTGEFQIFSRAAKREDIEPLLIM